MEHRYAEVARLFGAALERLAGGYEREAEARRDLLQEIHVALWRSLARYDGRCSLRTWVYRVAHNTAITRASGRARVRRCWSRSTRVSTRWPSPSIASRVSIGAAHLSDSTH